LPWLNKGTFANQLDNAKEKNATDTLSMENEADELMAVMAKVSDAVNSRL
jgi:hypothetical protein